MPADVRLEVDGSKVGISMGWNFHGLCPQYTNHVISRWNNPTHLPTIDSNFQQDIPVSFFFGWVLLLSHPKVWMVYTQLALSVIALIFESLREAGGGWIFLAVEDVLWHMLHEKTAWWFPIFLYMYYFHPETLGEMIQSNIFHIMTLNHEKEMDNHQLLWEGAAIISYTYPFCPLRCKIQAIVRAWLGFNWVSRTTSQWSQGLSMVFATRWALRKEWRHLKSCTKNGVVTTCLFFHYPPGN